jgi:SAM-dependent methyltransferase
LCAVTAWRCRFSNGSFDLIVIHLGLNNFDKSDAILAECARVAKPGARLVATSNLKGHYAEFYGLFRPIIESLGNSEYVKRLDANENHRGTVKRWSAALTAAGFTVTKPVEDSIIMRFLIDDTMLNHLLVRIGFLPAWDSVVDEAERPRLCRGQSAIERSRAPAGGTAHERADGVSGIKTPLVNTKTRA